MHTDLFRKMQRVRQLFFRCQSGHGSRMDWNHHGSGHTTITVEGNDIYFDDAFVLDNQRPCHDKKRWRFLWKMVWSFTIFANSNTARFLSLFGKTGN